MLVMEIFSNLFKKNLLEVGNMHTWWALWALDMSPYLMVILKYILKRREAMMFTSMVGVELVSEVADINNKVNKIILVLHF